MRRTLLVLHALLGGSLLGCGDEVNHLDLAADLLDRFDRALRRAVDGEREDRGQLALGEEADAVLAAACQTSGLQRVVVERGVSLDLAGVDRELDRAEVDLCEVLAEDVVEATLRQPMWSGI